MTTQQIADMIDGIIPLCIGLYGLFVLSRKPLNISRGLRKAIKPASIILIALGVLFTVKPLFGTRPDEVDYDYVVRKINEEKAGTFVDETTRLDSVVLGAHKEFIYNYTVTNMQSTETDSLFRENLKAAVTANLQNNPQVVKSLKNGIPIIIRYFGSDGILISEISFGSEPQDGQ